MKKHLQLIPLVYCLFLTPALFAQHYRDSLDLELGRLYKQTGVPGFYAMILGKEGVLYEKGFGSANIKLQQPFSKKTVENIGSVSKTFIAVALMKACELGYFTLETDINTILPYKVINPYFPNGIIKVRHLATHTSGIIDNDSIYNRSYQFLQSDSIDQTILNLMNERGYKRGLSDTTLETFLFGYLNSKGRLYGNHSFYNSKPGERSSYSNIGSALAAFLIEVRSGLTFAEFSKKYILQPLQMDQSTWFLNEVDPKLHAVPYLTKDLALPFYSLTTYPDGGLRTSASDLAKYVHEMMQDLATGRSRILNRTSIATMFAPAFTTANMPQNFSLATRNKGIFWNLYNDGFIGHDGDDPGISTNILFNRDYGLIFMTNIYLDDRSGFLNVLKKYASKL